MGGLPAEKEEASPDKYKLLQSLWEGMTSLEAVEDNPDCFYHYREIETVRQTILEDTYSSEARKETPARS